MKIIEISENTMQILDQSDCEPEIAKDDRVYYSLLQKVGTIGNYQYLLIFFCFIVGMQSSACFLVNPFLFYQQQFQCQGLTDNCRQFVCSLPQEQRLTFIPTNDGRNSMANQFGDHRCDNHQYVTLLNTSIILGSVIGIFAATFFVQCLGRRMTMILALVIAQIGLILSLFGLSQSMAVISMFLYGAGLDIAYSSVYAFVTQFFSQQDRHKYYSVIMLSFAVGIVINPIAFYFIFNWKTIVIYFFIIPTAIALIGFILIVENTPIQLISRHQPQYIYDALMRIAAKNGVTTHSLTIEGITQVKNQYDQNQSRKHNKIFSILDLVRYQSLRQHIIPLGIVKFLMMFIYYAPGLLLDQFSMSIYINGLVNALSQLVAIPFQYIAISQFNRKNANYLFFFSSALVVLIMYFVKDPNCSQNCQSMNTQLQTVLLFLYRTLCTIASGVVVVQLNETYPAQVRNLAVFVNISFGRSATLIVPFLVQLCHTIHLPFLIMLSLSSILAGFSICLTKQTFMIPPPQMVEQVKIQSHQYKYYSLQQQAK